MCEYCMPTPYHPLGSRSHLHVHTQQSAPLSHLGRTYRTIKSSDCHPRLDAMPYGRRHVVSWKGAMTAFFAIVLTILWLHLARILEAAPTPVTPISGVFADDSWIQYVRAPTSMTVLPRTVLPQLIKGNVTNPNGLITGDGPTTFSRLTASDPTPEIVVDFGTNTVGLVSIDFVGAYNLSEGLPGIRLAFSETLEYLTNDSDFSRSYNVSPLELG